MEDTFGFCLDDLTIEQVAKIIKYVKEIIPGYSSYSIDQDHQEQNVYNFNEIIYNCLLKDQMIPEEIKELIDFEMIEKNQLDILEFSDYNKNDKKEAKKILKNILKNKIKN